jgi:hypothetical protein
MLHTPENMIVTDSPIWDRIVRYRPMFYTKNLKAFVGYAKGQSVKYSMKGTRILDAQRVIEYLNRMKGLYLTDIWDNLPEGDSIHKHPAVVNNERYYEVCGKKFGERVTTEYAVNSIEIYLNQYGKRAIMAASNDGIDWKAVSHAFRAAYEVKQLLTEGTITFPLREAKELLKIKKGSYDYRSYVEPKLDELIKKVEDLSANSTYPEAVDRKFWDNFIVDTLQKYIL